MKNRKLKTIVATLSFVLVHAKATNAQAQETFRLLSCSAANGIASIKIPAPPTLTTKGSSFEIDANQLGRAGSTKLTCFGNPDKVSYQNRTYMRSYDCLEANTYPYFRTQILKSSSGTYSILVTKHYQAPRMPDLFGIIHGCRFSE